MAKNRGLGLMVIDYIRESSKKTQQEVLQQNEKASKELGDLRKNRPKSVYKDDMSLEELQESLENIDTTRYPTETAALRRRSEEKPDNFTPFQRLNTTPEGLSATFSQEGLRKDYDMTSNLSGFTPPSNEQEAATTNEPEKPKEDLRKVKSDEKKIYGIDGDGNVIQGVKRDGYVEHQGTIGSVAKNEVESKETPKKKGLSEDFRNALMRFGPQLGGMLIGGLMEGSEGAVAGGMAAAGNQALTFNQEMQENKLDLQQQNANTQEEFAALNRERFEAPQLSLTQGWTDSMGNPVTLDRKSGRFFNLAGEETRDVKQVQKQIDPLQQAKIENYKNIQQNREFSQRQRNEADAQQALKGLRATQEYKTGISTLTEVPNIRRLLSDAKISGGQSLAMLGPKVARGIAGEVGVMTDQDVTRYVKNPTLVGGLKDSLAKIRDGKISEVSAENLNRLLDIQEQAAKEKIDKAVSREATLFSRRSGLPIEEARALVDENYNISGGISYQEDMQKESSSSQDYVQKAIQNNRKRFGGN